MSSLSEIQQLAIKYCPVVYFRKDEKYFPSSSNYLLKTFPLTKNGVITDYKSVIKSGGDAIWSTGPLSNEYFLDIGQTTGGDGYSGPPDQNNFLYGDPYNPIQYITAYTMGEIKNSSMNTSFIDIVYAVYFCWNGTVDMHAFDVEEIILRFQKNGYSNSSLGYNDINVNILNAYNAKSTTEYYLARVFLSCHGNGMLYPTKFPNKADDPTTIEFLPGTCRPILFSGRGSHAMYPTPGIQKRIFGFGNDLTDRDIMWKPNRIAFWDNAFNLSSSGELSIGTLSELDITNNVLIPEPNPSLYLSYLNGVCGNSENSQNLVPFKNGLLNVVTSGDFYYQFQKGGADNVLNYALTTDTQTVILKACTAAFCGTTGFVIFASVYPADDTGELVIRSFIPFTAILMCISFFLTGLLALVGSTFNNEMFVNLISNGQVVLVSSVFLVTLFILGIVVVLPFALNFST